MKLCGHFQSGGVDLGIPLDLSEKAVNEVVGPAGTNQDPPGAQSVEHKMRGMVLARSNSGASILGNGPQSHAMLKNFKVEW